jgi:hypothetical protein
VKPFYAFAGDLLNALTFGDIDNAGDNKGALIRFNRIESDFDRHFAAVFPPTKQLAAGAHGSRAWAMKKVCSIIRVFSAKASRHQSLYSLAQQFRPRIAEQIFDLLIYESNAATVVNY